MSDWDVGCDGCRACLVCVQHTCQEQQRWMSTDQRRNLPSTVHCRVMHRDTSTRSPRWGLIRPTSPQPSTGLVLTTSWYERTFSGYISVDCYVCWFLTSTLVVLLSSVDVPLKTTRSCRRKCRFTSAVRIFEISNRIEYRVTTCLENLEMSGNLKHAREMSGNFRVSGEWSPCE